MRGAVNEGHCGGGGGVGVAAACSSSTFIRHKSLAMRMRKSFLLRSASSNWNAVSIVDFFSSDCRSVSSGRSTDGSPSK